MKFVAGKIESSKIELQVSKETFRAWLLRDAGYWAGAVAFRPMTQAMAPYVKGD